MDEIESFEVMKTVKSLVQDLVSAGAYSLDEILAELQDSIEQ